MPKRDWVRRTFLAHALAAVVSSTALLSSGCAALIGVQDTELEFQVVRQKNGSFFGWTEISVDQDLDSINKATLLAVTLDVTKPEGTRDLSFLKTITGEAVTSSQRVVVATADKFPRDEQAVAMTIQYGGDLRALFKDARTLRLEWKGQTNPAFTAWPTGGFWVRGRIKIEVE